MKIVIIIGIASVVCGVCFLLGKLIQRQMNRDKFKHEEHMRFIEKGN